MIWDGFAVARCTVEVLMHEIGLAGVVGGKPMRTIISDKTAPCPRHHVNRQFYRPAPNMLWSQSSPISQPAHPLAANVTGRQRAKPVPPQPHHLMPDVDTALEQQVFHVPPAQRKPHIHQHDQPDHVW